MAEYLSPGVYVEEYDSGSRAIEGVGTSTAGFVGMAEKGPSIGAPVFIGNVAEFRRVFGGYLTEFTYGPNRYLANSVEQFFANGGTRCFVSRVVAPGAKAASKKIGAYTFEAANEGKWGNRIQITFTSVQRKKMQITAKKEATYVARNAEGFVEGDVVCCNGEYNRITQIYDNEITFENKWKADIVDANLVPKTIVYLVATDIIVRYNDEVEKYTDASFNIENPLFVGRRLERSELIKADIKPVKEIANPVEVILGKGNTSGMITLDGGNDGNIGSVSATTYIGVDDGPGKRTGIQSFIENTVVSMMAVPGITIPEVMVGLVSHCENMKNRVAVLDMPRDYTKLNDLIDYRGMIDSTYAAMYHPWIQVLDRSTDKPGFVPPSGAVMGVYSRSDIARGVHKAPANEPVFATGLSVTYTKNEQDMLNPEGINLIRAIPGQGIRIWGARTASSNAAFKYVNVRRLFIYIEESIKANTNWVVFEPNDASLWGRINMSVSSFLDTCFRAGMFAGDSPESSYFVEIGPSTMTRDDIDNGRLICNIGIAPSKPAEFVIFRVTQHTAEAAGGGGEE